jgi:hypothetical protein
MRHARKNHALHGPDRRRRGPVFAMRKRFKMSMIVKLGHRTSVENNTRRHFINVEGVRE